MANRILGVDIGSYAIKIVEIDADRSNQRITALGQAVLAESACQMGEVINTDLVAKTLKDLCKRAGVVAKTAVVGISGTRVVIRTSELPSMDKQELDAAVSFEAIDLLPIPEADLVSGYVVQGSSTSSTGEVMNDVLIGGAYSKVVETATRVISKAGLKLAAIDVDALATERGLDWLIGLERSAADVAPSADEAHAVVDVGAQLTELSFFESGRAKFVRTILKGSENITTAIKAVTGETWEVAELAKREYRLEGQSEVSDDIARATEEAVEELTREISSTLEFYQLQSRLSRLDRIWVVGSGSRVDGFGESLVEKTGFEVSRPELLSIVQRSVGEVKLEDPSVVEYGFATALGLALHQYHKPELALNLIPKKVKASKLETRKDLMAGVGVGVFAILLVGVWLLHQRTVSSLNQSIISHQSQLTELQSSLAKLAPVSNLEKSIQASLTSVKTEMAGDVSWDKLISSIGNAVPGDANLTSLSLTASQGGAAQSASSTSSLGTGSISVVLSFASCSQQSPIDWLNSITSVPGLGQTWVSSSTVNPVVSGGQSCPGYPPAGANANEVGTGTFSSTTSAQLNTYLVPLSTYVSGVVK